MDPITITIVAIAAVAGVGAFLYEKRSKGGKKPAATTMQALPPAPAPKAAAPKTVQGQIDSLKAETARAEQAAADPNAPQPTDPAVIASITQVQKAAASGDDAALKKAVEAQYDATKNAQQYNQGSASTATNTLAQDDPGKGGDFTMSGEDDDETEGADDPDFNYPIDYTG